MKKIIIILLILLVTKFSQSQCVGNQTYTLSPNGPYTAGQNVTVTYTLNSFTQFNSNWIIAFDIDIGNGWSAINPVSAPGNPGGSSGSWIWDTQNTYPSGLNFGPGYRFQNSSWWNPDWGTSSTGPFTFSFQLTVGSSCTNNNLSISVSVIGDCQTGGWNNGSCCPIAPFPIYSGNSSGGNTNISIIESVNNISCAGFSDGSIDLNISGGTAPYTINWSNNLTTQNISGLAAGTYTATITDNLGCTETESYTLNNPPQYTPTIISSNITCYGLNNGTISVINEPQSTSYLWSNLQTTSSIDNLTPGNYSVDITNIDGCSVTEFINISEPNQITILESYNNIDCYGNNNGNIDLFINGGTPNYNVVLPPYSQTLTNGLNNFSSQSILSAGTYNYTVTDSNGCTYNDSITITEPSAITTSPVINNVLCNNESNGSIILNTNGGTFPYNEDFGGNNPSMLSAGNYLYTITDNNGCTISDTFSITEPDSLLSSEITNDATCAGYSDGNVSLIITGGTNPYTTNWNGNNPNNLNAGTYSYTVSDINGCITQGNITINEPAGIQMTINTDSVSCYGGNDGSVNLTISGGTGSTYNIDWGGIDPNLLSAGNYTITVSDSNNCSLIETVNINEPEEIQITSITNNVSCHGDTNGNAVLIITGGTAPFSQTWFGIDSSALAPGIYYYQVTDNNNCTTEGDITIYEPDILTATTSITNIDCYGDTTGSILLNITGGTYPYTADFGSFNEYSLPAGSYPFTVTDINGCTFDSVATVTQANQIDLYFVATSPICRNEESSLFINISNSSSNTYTIILEDSILKSFVIDTNGLLIAEQTPIILQPNFSNEVTIISMTDNNGCTSIFNQEVHIEVNQLPQLSLNTEDICIGESSFTLNSGYPEGGVYFIDNINTNFFDVENFTTGPHTVRYEYTDTITSCSNTIEDIITISESPDADFSFGPQTTDLENSSIYFKNRSSDIESSTWNLGDGTIINDSLSFWYTYNDTGTFIITYTVINEYNCTDTITNNIIINPTYSTFIPSAFSPNNDNKNDVFQPYVMGTNKYTILIFNRWGLLIHESENSFWDGKINNQLAQTGVYSYSITVYDINNKPYLYTGLVTLLD